MGPQDELRTTALKYYCSVTFVKFRHYFADKKGLSFMVNSVLMEEAQLTWTTISNQASFCWSVQRILVINLKMTQICMDANLKILWIPIGMTGFQLGNFAKQRYIWKNLYTSVCNTVCIICATWYFKSTFFLQKVVQLLSDLSFNFCLPTHIFLLKI